MLMPEVDLEHAMIGAERIRLAIGRTPFPEVGPVTVSIGVCALTEALDPAGLMSCADDALYEAKRAGRNRCVAYPSAEAAAAEASG